MKLPKASDSNNFIVRRIMIMITISDDSMRQRTEGIVSHNTHVITSSDSNGAASSSKRKGRRVSRARFELAAYYRR